jgi:glucose/arabinose dehydrogenase
MKSLPCPSRALLTVSILTLGGLLAVLPSARAQDICEGISPVQHSELETVAIADSVPGEPLLAISPPQERDRLFIVDQNGRILIHERGADPTQFDTFLDITSKVTSIGNEQGLLGLVFDPEYETTGEFYINYTENGTPGRSVVARYRVSESDPNAADPTSEERLIVLPQPESNHNAGQLLFGPDGFLYVVFGDGGGGGDLHGECGNAQNTGVLLGKLLRLDVRGLDPMAGDPDCGDGDVDYGIPSDNPLVDGPGGDCDEIWAWGVRNPWRNAFDRETGDFYLADVGQECWEEINYRPAVDLGGENYGWRQMEGEHCFDPINQSNCDPPPVDCGSSPDCFDPSLVLPILEYSHADGCSVTGGYVYRGCLMPDLSGRYFYGEYCSGWVRSFRVVGGEPTDQVDHTDDLFDNPDALRFDLTSFGTDAEGELYVVDQSGTIFKVVPAFEDLQVSGPGAGQPLQLGDDGWRWEDLQYSVGYPVDSYRVYRGLPGDPFDCIHETTSTSWAGDPQDPAPSEQFAYLVTGLYEGRETSPGEPSPGIAPRELSAAPCP